jgi:hypothetical protein
VTIDTAISGLPTCVRKAWLVHPNGSQIQLDNPAGGWMCQSLDLGTPVMRTVMNNNPDRSGIIDRTQYMGARTVTAAITALTGAGAQIDAVAASFASYMDPSVRPVLHYVLDRPGAPERTLTLRADSYDWPIVGAAQRDIALQWIAPDPVSYGATQQVVTLAVNVPQHLNSPGDVGFRPLFVITGPLTANIIIYCDSFDSSNNRLNYNRIKPIATYALAAGATMTIDCVAHTVMVGTTSILTSMDWTQTNWPLLPVSPAYANCQLTGTGFTAATQLVASWYDGYLA